MFVDKKWQAWPVSPAEVIATFVARWNEAAPDGPPPYWELAVLTDRVR